jgi:hypothetical protein
MSTWSTVFVYAHKHAYCTYYIIYNVPLSITVHTKNKYSLKKIHEIKKKYKSKIVYFEIL